MISNFINSKIQITPKDKAVFYMSICMGIHFSGHELARAPITSLFTSKEIGFNNSAALPLAVGVVSPFSIIMLYIFKKVLQRHGPRNALMQSTLVYSTSLLSVALALSYLTTRIDGQQHIRTSKIMDSLDTHMTTKSLLFAIFVFQSANVQFLYTQHWSFLGSILTAEEGKVWFAPIAGLGSITSTLAAANVSKLVDSIGLIGLLCCAAMVIGSSSFFADQAYSVARKNGFEPSNNNNGKGKKEDDKTFDEIKDSKGISDPTKSSKDLFQRVPILKAMFFEVILSQCLSSLLNFQFMVTVKDAITDDEERAGWTGGCYAYINGISGAMQFLILPIITKRVHSSYLWLLMPSTMLLLTAIQFYQNNPSLALVGFTFLTMKIIEYSLRGQVSEMAFASLDYESRFIGKQKINLFANRLGKSGMAASLFLLATYMDKDVKDLNRLLLLASNGIACLWLLSTVQLTRFIDKPKSVSD